MEGAERVSAHLERCHAASAHSRGDTATRQPVAHRPPARHMPDGRKGRLSETSAVQLALDSQTTGLRACGHKCRIQHCLWARAMIANPRARPSPGHRASKGRLQNRVICRHLSFLCRATGSIFDPRRAPIRMLAVFLLALMLPMALAQPAVGSRALLSASGTGPSWWMPASRRDSIRGGSLLTFAGSHFDLGETYVARFAGVNHEAVSDSSVVVEAAAAHPTSSSQLVVVVPPWPTHEANVTVSLLETGSMLAVARGNTTIFQYLAGWSSVRGSSAPLRHPPSDYARSSLHTSSEGICSPLGSLRCSVPVSGGALLTVSGIGFQQRHCPENDFCIDVLYVLRLTSTEDGPIQRSG